MAEPHPFLVGRAILPLVPLFAVTYATAFLLWHAAISFDRCSVSLTELSAVASVIVGGCLISPKMATWEALSAPKVRLASGLIALAMLTSAATLPIGLSAAITHLPANTVPQSSSFDLDEITLGLWLPNVANILVVGTIGLVAVATLGRVVGVLASAITYVVLIWLSMDSHIMTPYTPLCSTDTGGPVWVPATSLTIAAIAIWCRTGGSTVIARYLDPRDRGT